jgi:immunity protein 53 of polymorphic toxin system
MNSIQWLQQWYHAQCNDTWEHQHGITIQSLDNPGWLVKIDLAGTPLQSLNMREVGKESHVNHKGIEGQHDWLHCTVKDGFFVGAGGPFSLLSICNVFRNWVEKKIGQ